MAAARPLNISFLMLCVVMLPCVARGVVPTEQEVRAAIDAIEKDPLGAVEAGHAKTVMTFAEESPEVLIMLDRELLPTWGDKKDPHAAVLNAAFVAGNVKAQLDAKKNKDDSYAGLQSLFKAYHAIQAKDNQYKVDAIDKLEAMDKEGKLKAKVEEIQKRHNQ
jgi:hypothetical protein